MSRTLEPGLRVGGVTPPPSKSHAHRVLIAEALSGRFASLAPQPDDCADIVATKRCLTGIYRGETVLDCGESGTTRRLLGPLVPALGRKAAWTMRGRLASRPQIEYDGLTSGRHELRGDVSSQFASGLLFALPLLVGDSEIRFTTPLQSRGYVEMTRDVLSAYGIRTEETPDGYFVPGGQRYVAPASPLRIEADWSGAAFWLAANALGNRVAVSGLDWSSRQPDRRIADVFAAFPPCVDVDPFPDSFPVLSVAAACRAGMTEFVGIRRLRLKESDRVAAMSDVLSRFGVRVEVGAERFVVHGKDAPLRGGEFAVFGDHRVAMSVAVAATRAEGPVTLDDETCVGKSYLGFWRDFDALSSLRFQKS